MIRAERISIRWKLIRGPCKSILKNAGALLQLRARGHCEQRPCIAAEVSTICSRNAAAVSNCRRQDARHVTLAGTPPSLQK
jgi:hypothetical protein